MEGGVARSSIGTYASSVPRTTYILARRVELEREPDLQSVDLRGCAAKPAHYPKKSPIFSRIEFLFRHPMVRRVFLSKVTFL